MRKIIQIVQELVLGKHPDNTIFSFNYHNIRHLNSFLRNVRRGLSLKAITIVDVGGGACPYYPIFSDISHPYVVVDLTENLRSDNSRLIKKVSGYAELIPLKDGIADIVLCNQVLEHVNDPDKAIIEIYRILKHQGLFIGSVPHISPVHLEPNDFRRYTDLGIKMLLTKSNFINIRTEGNGGVYLAAALMIAMDWVLSVREDGKPQSTSGKVRLLLSPLIGLLNFVAIILEKIFIDKKRTPSNICWVALKP